MPTSRVHLGDKQGKFWVSPDKLKAMVECPLQSSQIDCNAATGTIVAVEIPAGAYVYRVAVLADTAVAGGSGDIDVGDGVVTDRYVDALSALAVDDMKIAGSEGTGAADPQGGHYYSAADTIDVKINATAAAGSIRILVWYDIIDTRV